RADLETGECVRVAAPDQVLAIGRRPPGSPPVPYTTLFRSQHDDGVGDELLARRPHDFAQLAADFAKIAPETGRKRLVRCVACLRRHGHVWSHPLPTATDAREAHTHRSEEHTSELQSRENLVCRLLLEKKKEIGRADVRTPA